MTQMTTLTKKREEVLKTLLHGELTTYALGKKLGIARVAAKTRADPLIEEGYIETQKTTENGKQKRIYTLTNQGRTALQQLLQQQKKEADKLLPQLKQ